MSVAMGLEGARAASSYLPTSERRAAGRLQFIDPLRGFAVLWVFLYHAVSGDDRILFSGSMRDVSDLYRVFFLPMNLGYLGVAVFFVISGFCIHLSFVQQGRSWRDFLVRRFFRLYPAYLVALLFFAFVLPYSRLRWTADGSAGWSLFNHLALVHNLHPGSHSGINASFWTIGVEVQLYLLYPVVIWIAGRFGWAKVLVVTGACEISIIGARLLLPLVNLSPDALLGPIGVSRMSEVFYRLGATPFAFWLSWAMGAWLAELYLQGKPCVLSKIPGWIMPAITVIFYMFVQLHLFTFVAAALATFIIMARCLDRERSGSATMPGWLGVIAKVGIYSYSIYLLHQPLMYAITANLLHHWDYPRLLHYGVSLCTAIFIFPMAWLLYHYVEKPGIAFGKRLLSRVVPRTGDFPSAVTAGR